MKLPIAALRKAYYDALSTITYNGEPLKVYDTVAPDDTVLGLQFHYVLVKEMNAIQILKRYGATHRVRVNVDIVTGYAADGGFKMADEIGDLISQKVNPIFGETLAPAGYVLTLSQLVNSTNLFQPTSTHRVYRLILSFEHNLGEVS